MTHFPDNYATKQIQVRTASFLFLLRVREVDYVKCENDAIFRESLKFYYETECQFTPAINRTTKGSVLCHSIANIIIFTGK
jgi:hypothetical protein